MNCILIKETLGDEIFMDSVKSLQNLQNLQALKITAYTVISTTSLHGRIFILTMSDHILKCQANAQL